MKLMVAGCSFSAPSKTLPGTSWSEKLAHRLGWDLENLARQGCSNGGVRIQIDEILRQRPTFAILTPTFWDRMEIPARAAPFDWDAPSQENNPNLPQGWSPKIQQHLQDRSIRNGYRREDGINNVNYGDNNSNMICETIFTLAQGGDHGYRPGKISKSTQTAIKHYIDAIYDSEWKRQQDEWIIKEGIFELYHAGIDFLFVPVLLWPFHPKTGEKAWQEIMPATIPSRYIMSRERESVLPICGNNMFTGDDPGYHSNETAQEIIAENYYQRITKDFKLSSLS